VSRKCARPDVDLSALESFLEATEFVLRALGPKGPGGASRPCSELFDREGS